MTKYQENFIDTTSVIKKLLKIKMVTLLLGHPVHDFYRREYFSLKLYCGYKYTKPCMINRIWGLKQL